MPCKARGQRFDALREKEGAVEFALYLGMGDAGNGDLVLDIAVAGGIQREVADKAEKVCLRACPQGRGEGGKPLLCGGEKSRARGGRACRTQRN